MAAVLEVEAVTEERVRRLIPAPPHSPVSTPNLSLPKTMFSQYGSNLTEDGHVFKPLGAILATTHAEVSIEAPQ